MSTTRINQRALERIESELTERDRRIVSMLSTLHLATGNQVTRAVWPGATEAEARAARRALKRLVEWRVLARLERRLGGLGRGSDSFTYALDVAGQRLARCTGSRRRPHLPQPAMWRHVLLTTEVYVRVLESLAGTERRLVEWQGEPDCWRDVPGPYGEITRLKPDGFLRITGPRFEDLYFLESDTGSQSRTVLRAKLEAYRRHAASGSEQATRGGVYPQVVFVTLTPARHAAIVDLLGGLPTESWRLFAVGQVEDIPRLFGDPGTPS